MLNAWRSHIKYRISVVLSYFLDGLSFESKSLSLTQHKVNFGKNKIVQQTGSMSRGSGKIWWEESTITARSAVPRAAAREAHLVSSDFFQEGTLVASRRVCFRSFAVILLIQLFSRKEGIRRAILSKFQWNTCDTRITSIRIIRMGLSGGEFSWWWW